MQYLHVQEAKSARADIVTQHGCELGRMHLLSVATHFHLIVELSWLEAYIGEGDGRSTPPTTTTITSITINQDRSIRASKVPTKKKGQFFLDD